ncbi:hypothetical protein [Spirosoma harenae]
MKRYAWLFGFCFTVLVGCHPKQDDQLQLVIPPTSPVASTTSTAATTLSDPLVPDSITFYRPQLGKATTDAQFPFGLTNQPTTNLRLAALLYKGKTVRSYQYDPQGRLTQRTDYYTNGLQIFRQFSYSYGQNGIATITAQLNKEAPVVEGYPKRSELLPSATVSFNHLIDSLSQIEKTTLTEFAVYKFELGLTRSRLGFSPSGLLVWEEVIDANDKLSQYTLYRPDQRGNILFSRTGSLGNHWQTLQFTYDDKPNPFRTTGDPQLVDFGELHGISVVTNTNNALTQSLLNAQGGRVVWRYTYEYRTDGYPSRMTAYRNEELDGIYEFVYNSK